MVQVLQIHKTIFLKILVTQEWFYTNVVIMIIMKNNLSSLTDTLYKAFTCVHRMKGY